MNPSLRTAWDHRVAGPALRLGLLVVGLPLGINVVFERNPPAGLLLNGLVIGSLYSLIAMGLVLVHRISRIINFAQAGMGAAPAVLALLLYTSRGVPYVVAIVVALAGAAMVGAGVETTVVRRFSSRPRLILTVATIGVAQVLAFVEFFLPKWVSGDVIPPTSFTTPFTRYRREIGGVYFTGDHLVTVLVVLGIAGGLGAFFRYTRLGIAVRATAENPDRARLLGIPTHRVSRTVWVLAAVLSSVGVFLRAPLVGLPLGSLIGPAVLFFALTAAVIARMDSLPMALVAGMAIGVLDQAAFFATQSSEISNALMLPIVLVALLVQRRTEGRTPAADEVLQSVREPDRLPADITAIPAVAWARRVWFVLVGVLVVAAPLLVGRVRYGVLTLIVIYAMIGVSVVVLTGWAGQISLGQFAFAGVGAAVAGGLIADAGTDVFVSIIAAGLVGAVLSLIIGLPALRLPGLFLAAATLAFSANASSFFLNRRWFRWLLPEPENPVYRPVLFGRIDLRSDLSFYYATVVVLALALVSAAVLRRSRSGRLFIGARDDPRALQAYGADLARTRLAAFAYSGFVAAAAGALLSMQQGAVDAGVYGPQASIQIFAMVVIGGLSSLWGAVAGAMYVVGFQYLLPDYQLLATGAGMLVLLLVFPGGLSELGHRIRDELVARLVPRPPDGERAVEETVEDTPGAGTVRSAPAEDDVLLRAEQIELSYGSVQILFGVDFEVRQGEILALLGTNGAGKSTLLRAISGLAGSSGTMTFGGEDLTRLDVRQRVIAGVVQMPGGAGVFPSLSVEQNLRLAGWIVDTETAARSVDEVYAQFPVLAERRTQRAGDLSGGEQQMLALGLSFVQQPRLLMIDELSLGLAPVVVEELLGIVRRMHEAGTTIVLVEQSVNVALSIADRAYFLEKGAVRFEGPTKDLLARDDILRAVFLPSASDEPERRTDDDPGHAVDADRVVLRATDLRRTFGGITAVDSVSFDLHGGEILGLIGHNGAGKTTILDLISGHQPVESGTIELLGREVTRLGPSARSRLGLGRSFQDARLFPSLSVAENLALALERHLHHRDHLAAALGLPLVRAQEEHIAWTVADLCELLGLVPHRHKRAGELSTGMRRIVDLGMALAHDPDVLLLDEPSAGIAQREAESLPPLLRRVRDETGCAIVVIEHDIPLMLTLCDRLLALETGAVIAEGSPVEVVAHPRVVASYLGTDESTVHRSGALT